MKPWLSILLYSLLRLAVFAVPLTLLVIIGTPLGLPFWAAALWAALIGIALSVLVLGRFRDPVSERLYQARHVTASSTRDAESDLENRLLDQQEQERDRSPASGSADG